VEKKHFNHVLKSQKIYTQHTRNQQKIISINQYRQQVVNTSQNVTNYEEKNRTIKILCKQMSKKNPLLWTIIEQRQRQKVKIRLQIDNSPINERNMSFFINYQKIIASRVNCLVRNLNRNFPRRLVHFRQLMWTIFRLTWNFLRRGAKNDFSSKRFWNIKIQLYDSSTAGI